MSARRLLLASLGAALLCAGAFDLALGAPRTRPRAPAAKATPPAAESAPLDLSLPVAAMPVSKAPPANQTRCGLCHGISGWDDVRFDHDKTGFPLLGNHRRVTCKACHPSDFKTKIPRVCAGCHRDPHAAEFGLSCEGCHSERSWKTDFNVDAHRRTNFPLSGRHALIPCTECHPQARDRVFSRSPVTCVTCHLADYQSAAMRSIDHVAAGFSTDCRGCHTSFRWSPGRFPQHDQCFQLSVGPHAGIRCLTCHSTLPMLAGSAGACSTNNAACSSCHEHDCSRTDRQHTNVPGYQCKDRKCYECHRFSSAR